MSSVPSSKLLHLQQCSLSLNMNCEQRSNIEQRGRGGGGQSVLFRDHNRSLLKRQPEACISITYVMAETICLRCPGLLPQEAPFMIATRHRHLFSSSFCM